MAIYAKRIEAKYVRDRDFTHKAKICRSEDVYEFAKTLAFEIKEKFVVLHLDGSNNVICFDVVSIGTTNSAIVIPKDVFRTALLSNAEALILIHNHPSGSTKPSSEDLAITKKVCDSGKLIGIKVLDHIIVTENGYCSLADEGLLDFQNRKGGESDCAEVN